MSEKSGVYHMLDQEGKILYIGKAVNLKKRVTSYTRVDQLPYRLQRMVFQIRNVMTIITQNEIEALLLESNLIKKERPPYNILLKDDKSYSYILIDKKHPFPKAQKYRGIKQKDKLMFGPFASSEAIDETLITLQKLFQIRNCKNTDFEKRTRPCLQYDIKRCSAPCVKKISSQDYKTQLMHAISFLQGKNSALQEQLSHDMQHYSDMLDFEKAAEIRDRIRLLTKIQAEQRISVNGVFDADIIALTQQQNHVCAQAFSFRNGHNYGGQVFFFNNNKSRELPEVMKDFVMQFYQNTLPASKILVNINPDQRKLVEDALYHQHGIKVSLHVPKKGEAIEVVLHAQANAQKSLEKHLIESASHIKIFKELQELLQLTEPITRVECYDNSHIQGKSSVGAMVVANTEGFDKKSYRKFNIQTPQSIHGGDDYAMMEEVLRRRIKRADEWPLPHVILIDGGKGQIRIAQQEIDKAQLNTQIVGIAKGENRNASQEVLYLPDKSTLPIERNSLLFYFLQRIRDEAHRFAITTHRAKRDKNAIKSALDTIDGVGAKRKKALLTHFGSVREIRYASISDIKKVSGISHDLAQKIYESLH